MAISTSIGVLEPGAQALDSPEPPARRGDATSLRGDGREGSASAPTSLQARGADLLSRVVSGIFFVLLSRDLVQEYLRTRHLTGLLLLLSESLVVMLIIFRRPAMQVDRSTRARVVTAVSLAGPPLLRTGGVPLLPDMATAAISVVGVALALASKMSIGRSFGLVPANRGVVDRGPYALVRHPIYAGYLISHVGFLCAHPTVMNAALLVVADAALVYRALLEERTLAGDPRYRTYMQRVAWHLVPGVF